MQFKAPVVGMDSGTFGCSIIEQLVLDCDYSESEEWMEIYNVITSSKVCIISLILEILIDLTFFASRKGEVIASIRTSSYS